MKRIHFYKLAILSGLFYTSTGIAEPTVYIPLGSGNEVISVDANTDKITATFTGVENPHGLVATPDGEYLVAGSLVETPLQTGQSENMPNSKLYVIHPAHGHVMLTIPVSGWTHHQAITPDGRYVISTHATRGYVSVTDLQNNQVARTIATGPGPNYTVVTKNGKYAYVSNSGNGTISEIDLSSWKVTRTLNAGASPEHMVFSKDESIIFVANPHAGTVSAVSVKDGNIVRSFEIGKSVHGLDMGDDGNTLFVSSKKENKLVSIETNSGEKKELQLSPAPYHLNTIRGTGKVYVSSRSKPVIWVVDQEKLEVINTIQLPKGEAHQMAIVE